MKTLIATLTFVCFSWQILASTQLNFPGSVPRDDSRLTAADLFLDGRVLLPSEAQELKNAGNDLSLINPKESDLWKNTENELSASRLNFSNGDTLSYLSFVLSRSGNFRFSGILNAEGSKKIFTVLLSKKVHNVLLRAGLLKKLGYRIPDIKYVTNLNVEFSSPFEKENFLGRLAEDTLGDTSRWVIQNGDSSLRLQDVLVMEGQQSIYNLALGSIPAGTIQNRRVLNSLLVPFTLTDVPESVNLFAWNGFSIISNNVRFDYEANDDFNPSYDDVRWMARRIEKLTREDFEEIVRFAQFPVAVEKLLVEKLIARRNTLLLVTGLASQFLPYNDRIDFEQDLVDGKIVKENWEGYASRFAYGDPESPLSASQVFAFLKNKAVAFALNKLVSEVNTKVMPQTDLEQKIINKQMDIAEENLAQYLKTGEVKSTAIQAWAVPHYGTNILLSRDIVTGSYLGTDNLVQLADSIGFGVDLGVYLGASNLPIPWQGSGQLRANYLRRYSHIKPIQTMKIKMPWKNILVPWLLKTKGHIFDDVVETSSRYQWASDKLASVKNDLLSLNQIIASRDGELSNALTLLETLLENLKSPTEMVASLVKEREVKKEEEKIEEGVALYKQQIKNKQNAEVIKSLETSLENTPVFNNPDFENEKQKLLTQFKESLEKIKEQASDQFEVGDEILVSWSSLKHRLSVMSADEKVQGKISFVNEALAILKGGSESFTWDELASLVEELPLKIDQTNKDLISDKKERISLVFKTIKSELSIGESLLITDSLGVGAGINATLNSMEALQVLGAMNANQMILSRLHIYRSSENVIQIYKDFGNVSGFGLRAEIRSGIPTITITGNLNFGKARTKFYQLSLANKEDDQSMKVASALRTLMVDNNLELVQSLNKPFVIEHDFKEKTNLLSFLFWDWKRLKSSDELVVKHPAGSERKFYRILAGKRFSTDYMNLISDLILGIRKGLSALFHVGTGGDAGSDNYFGKGVVRQLSFEGEDVDGKLTSPTANISYSWKGWSISHKNAQKIINKINERFDAQLYYPEVLNDTTSLQLYNISCNVYIYPEGLSKISLLPSAQIENLFRENLSSYGGENNENEVQAWTTYFVRYQKKYLKALAHNNVKEAMSFGEKLISILESKLPMKEIKKIVSEKNILITSRVQGFRKGDENGDRPIVANTWGEIGSSYSQGPLAQIRSFIGMTDSEFLASWIMGRP